MKNANDYRLAIPLLMYHN